jgi:hypothetical protein
MVRGKNIIFCSSEEKLRGHKKKEEKHIILIITLLHNLFNFSEIPLYDVA